MKVNLNASYAFAVKFPDNVANKQGPYNPTQFDRDLKAQLTNLDLIIPVSSTVIL